MQHLETWFCDGFGSVKFTGGLNDLKSTSQPKWFYDCMLAWVFNEELTLFSLALIQVREVNDKSNLMECSKYFS